MALWNEFLQGDLPYQHYWLPLIIGMVAGMLCLFMGSCIGRARKRTVAPAPAPAAPDHDPFVHGSLTDHRKSLRRSGNFVEILYADPQNRDVTRRALVLDRSIGGLRLAAEEEMAPDSRLVVLPVHASELVPWVEIDVRTCRRVEDCWELGCQFVKTPQWSILLLFG
jgi:hypothetical protein